MNLCASFKISGHHQINGTNHVITSTDRGIMPVFVAVANIAITHTRVNSTCGQILYAGRDQSLKVCTYLTMMVRLSDSGELGTSGRGPLFSTSLYTRYRSFPSAGLYLSLKFNVLIC